MIFRGAIGVGRRERTIRAVPTDFDPYDNRIPSRAPGIIICRGGERGGTSRDMKRRITAAGGSRGRPFAGTCPMPDYRFDSSHPMDTRRGNQPLSQTSPSPSGEPSEPIATLAISLAARREFSKRTTASRLAKSPPRRSSLSSKKRERERERERERDERLG